MKRKLFDITEHISDLNFLFDRIDVLTDDTAEQISGRINLKTERGIECAKYELEIVKIKIDMLQTCVKEAAEEINKLTKLAEDTYAVVSSDAFCEN